MKKVMGWLMGKMCLWSEQSFPIISVSGFENTHVQGEGREGKGRQQSRSCGFDISPLLWPQYLQNDRVQCQF